MTDELTTILLVAQDSNNPQFVQCQQLLIERAQTDPLNFSAQLLEICGRAESPIPAVFLSLVMIKNIFENLMLPISKDHPKLESGMPEPLNIQFLELSFAMFHHKYAPIRNSAVQFFCSVVSTQTETPLGMGIKQRLIECLANTASVEGSLSAMEAICTLSVFLDFTNEDQQAIIQILLGILSAGCNRELVSGCILLFGNFADRLTGIFQNEADLMGFIGQLMNFIDEFRKPMYTALAEMIQSKPGIAPPMFPKLLEVSVDDLTNSSDREILMSCLNMWMTIVTRNELMSPGFLAALDTVIRALMMPLLRVVGCISTEEVLDYEEWEPYTAALSCLSCFASKITDVTVPLLMQFVEATNASEDPIMREVSLKALRIIYSYSDNGIDAVFGLIAERMGDPVPRVRFAAAECLDTMLEKLPPSWSVLCGFQVPLMHLAQDTDATAKLALRILRVITAYDDFADFAGLFSSLTGIMEGMSVDVLAAAVDCLGVAANPNVTSEVASNAFVILHTILQRVFSGYGNFTLLKSICSSMAQTLTKVDAGISTYAEEIYTSMMVIFREKEIGYALTAITALTIPIPDFIISKLPELLPVVLEAQTQYADPDVIVASTNAVLSLFRLPIGDFKPRLIYSLVHALMKGSSALAKREILETFSLLMKMDPEAASIAAPPVFQCIQFIITRINDAAIHYGDQLSDLVSVISRLLIQLFPCVDHAAVFEASVALLQSFPTLQFNWTGCVEDVADLVIALMSTFGDVMKQAMQQNEPLFISCRTIIENSSKSCLFE